MPSRAALELLLQLKDEASAQAENIEAALGETTIAYDEAKAAQDRLRLAQLQAEAAAQRLADAQLNLAHNTDPDKEQKLATEVAKASVAFDTASEKAQKLARAINDTGTKARFTLPTMAQLGNVVTGIGSAWNMAEKAARTAQQMFGATIGKAVEYAKKVEEAAKATGRSIEEVSAEMGTLITEDQLRKTLAMQKSLDNLSSKADSLALKIGFAAAPALDALVTEMIREVDISMRNLGIMQETLPVREEMVRYTTEEADALNSLAVEVEQYQRLLEDTTVTYGRITDATGEFGDAMDQTWREKSAAYNVERAAEAMNTLNLAMSVIEPRAREFQSRIGELSGEAGAYRDRIAELEAKRWLTPKQRAELEETKTKLGEVQGSIAAVTEEYNTQMREFVFNEAVKAAAASGGETTLAEAQALDALAKSLDLVGQPSLVLAQQIQDEIGVVDRLLESGKLTQEQAAASLTATAGRASTWFQRIIGEAASPFDEYKENLAGTIGQVRELKTSLEELGGVEIRTTVTRISGASAGAGGHVVEDGGEGVRGRQRSRGYP